MRYDKATSQFALVGIAYGGDSPNFGKLRGGDYTPTRAHPEYAETPFGGGSDSFVDFLVANVSPMVQKRYRVDRSNE